MLPPVARYNDCYAQVPGHAHVRHLRPPEDRHEGSRPPARPGPPSRKGTNACFTIVMFWEFGRGSEYGIHPIAHGTNASHQCKLSNTAAVCIVSHNTRSSAAPRATSASAALVLSNFDIGLKYIFAAKCLLKMLKNGSKHTS